MNRRGFLGGLLALPLYKLAAEAHVEPQKLARVVSALRAAKVETPQVHKIFMIDDLDLSRNVRALDRRKISNQHVERDNYGREWTADGLTEESIQVQVYWETPWLPYMHIEPGIRILNIDGEKVKTIMISMSTVMGHHDHGYYELEFRTID